jgi:predicted permease
MSKSFDGMAAYNGRQFTLTGLDRPEVVRGASVGGDFFAIIGAQPHMGRLFTDADDKPGSKVAVISDRFWKSHFGSSPNVLNRKLVLSDEPYSIIGVAQPSLQYDAWRPTYGDIWVPLAMSETDRAERKNHYLQVISRLKPGVAQAQAQAEMSAISRQLESEYPEADKDWGATVMSLRENLVGNLRPVLLVLLGAVAFVLLIACANVANLITARNLSRRKELAVRAALGASRRRALQQLLAESVLVSLIGGALGLAVAYAAVPLLVSFVNQQFRIARIPLDTPVLLFTLAISIVTGVLSGAVPAWRGSKADVNDALKQGSRGASDSGTRRTRSILVAAEVALSLMLLAGAGLMMRSLWMLTGVDPGFDPKNVLTLTAISPAKELPKSAAYFEDVLDQLRATPGVDSAGMVESLPLQGGSVQPFTIEGRPAAVFAQQPTVQVRRVTPGYFHAMRTPLLRGRDFSRSDTVDRMRVVVISDSMAKKFWPNEDPIGKHLTLSFSPEKPCEIVGIVGDVKQDNLDAMEPAPTLYSASGQWNSRGLAVVVRGRLPLDAITPAIKDVIARSNPNQPVRNVQTLQSIVDESIADRRMTMFLLAAFAGLALLLAAFGLYSVLAYTVRRRVREIGIRLALGASARDVLSLVAMESMRPTAVGILIGLIGSIALSTLLTNLVYGIRPSDPWTFASVALVLAVVSMIASIIPAWRATRVDPLQVLREE